VTRGPEGAKAKPQVRTCSEPMQGRWDVATCPRTGKPMTLRHPERLWTKGLPQVISADRGENVDDSTTP
jgi:hypothetical protein